MIIRINVDNNSISFKNKEIKIEKNGLYQLCGRNGCGKTTVLKNIVFESKFDDENCCHFSYVEQEPRKYDISVHNYITRLNKNIDTEEIIRYLSLFDLNYLNLKDSIMNLSGGEIEILSIISSLCKDTEYIFLDEPTNNLDENRINVLKNHILSLKDSKTIIFISHDERFDFEKCNKILIENNDISINYTDDETVSETTLHSANVSYPAVSIVKRAALRKTSILTNCLVLFIILFIGIVNWVAFKGFYSVNDRKANNSILILCVCFEDINEAYIKESKIKNNLDENIPKMMYNDLVSVFENDAVECAYITNEEYLDEVGNDLTYGRNTVELSFPNEFMSYAISINSLLTNDMLSEGRFPNDFKNEIVLPNAMKGTGLNEMKIGDKMLYDNSEYTIVGFHKENIIVTSYDDDSKYVIKINKNNVQEFVNALMQFYTEKYPAEYAFIPEMIVKTKEGKEKTVLDDLITRFPTNGYNSNVFGKTVCFYRNKKFLFVLAIVNLCIVLLYTMILFKMGKQRKTLLEEEFESFDNYYLTLNKTKIINRNVEIVNAIMILLISIPALIIIADYSTEIYISISAATILTFACVFGLVKIYAD